MAGKTLHFNSVVKNIHTGNLYACEYKECTLAALPQDAVVITYAKSCRRLADGSLKQRGRKNHLWTAIKFRRDALEFTRNY